MEEPIRQSNNITPARMGTILVITLDTSSHVYDLSSVDIGAPWKGLGADHLYITLIADVDFYYGFDSVNTDTLDETQALAAGGTINNGTNHGFTGNGAWLVPAKTAESIRINRTKDKFLYLKGSGAGKVRIRASSEMSASAA